MQATYILSSQNGRLIARDAETGRIVAQMPFDMLITPSTDCLAVVAHFSGLLVGEIVSVDHERNAIVVTARITEADIAEKESR